MGDKVGGTRTLDLVIPRGTKKKKKKPIDRLFLEMARAFGTFLGVKQSSHLSVGYRLAFLVTGHVLFQIALLPHTQTLFHNHRESRKWKKGRRNAGTTVSVPRFSLKSWWLPYIRSRNVCCRNFLKSPIERRDDDNYVGAILVPSTS